MRLVGRNVDRARYLLWPVRFTRKTDGFPPHWGWHGWHVRYENVSREKTSAGCMPGYRAVYGQTLHLGRLLILFGPGGKAVRS